MGRNYRSYAKHVYIDMITGSIDNPGKGNLSFCGDKNKQTVGYFHSYGSINSHLDEENMCWIVTRGKKEIQRYYMNREQIIKYFTLIGTRKANEIQNRINSVTQKLVA